MVQGGVLAFKGQWTKKEKEREREGVSQEEIGPQSQGKGKSQEKEGGHLQNQRLWRKQIFVFIFFFSSQILLGEFRSVLVERRGQKPDYSQLGKKEEVKKQRHVQTFLPKYLAVKKRKEIKAMAGRSVQSEETQVGLFLVGREPTPSLPYLSPSFFPSPSPLSSSFLLVLFSKLNFGSFCK